MKKTRMAIAAAVLSVTTMSMAAATAAPAHAAGAEHGKADTGWGCGGAC